MTRQFLLVANALVRFRLLGRYTFIADDYAPLSTRRAAVLVGLKFPTGSDTFGTPSFDPSFGAVGTWAMNRHEVDLDALNTVSTERQDVEEVTYAAASDARLGQVESRMKELRHVQRVFRARNAIVSPLTLYPGSSRILCSWRTESSWALV